MRDGVDVAAVAEVAPDSIVVIDTDMVARWANRTAEELFGWEPEAWLGRSVAPLVHPDDLSTAILSLGTVVDKAIGTAVEIRVRDAAGAYRWVEIRGRAAPDTPGIAGIVLSVRDLTDRRRWEVAQGDSGLFRAIVQHAPSVTVLMDCEGRIRSASRALTRILGYDLEQIEGRVLTDLVCPGARAEAGAHLRRAAQQPNAYRFEARLEHADGHDSTPFDISTVNLAQDPVVGGIVASLHDVTALERVRAHLEHLAAHDPLTGLANRSLLIEHLELALARARRHGRDLALFFIDLDDFKTINDRLGHQAGDTLLQQVAATLRDAVRASDLVARVGGDEFVVLAPDNDATSARQFAERIDASLREPRRLGTRSVTVCASVGYAVSTAGAGTADELLRRADDAMYRVKAEHGRDPHHARLR